MANGATNGALSVIFRTNTYITLYVGPKSISPVILSPQTGLWLSLVILAYKNLAVYARSHNKGVIVKLISRTKHY